MAGFSWALNDAQDRLIGSRSLFSVSEVYHENSKILAAAPGIAHTPETLAVGSSGYKRYTYSPSVELPRPDVQEALELTLKRRSQRSYGPQPLSLGQVSDIAFAACGSTEIARRSAPSAGGLFPLELYVAALNVEGLVPAVYHYDVRHHRLDEISLGDCRSQLQKAIFIEEAIQQAAAVFILSGVFGRSKIKYGERAYRFILLEAGHVMQNLLICAEASGLAACPVGGFVDDGLNDLLDIDGVEEAVLYTAMIGATAEEGSDAGHVV